MVRQIHSPGPEQQLRPLQALLPRRPAVLLRPDESRAPPRDPRRPQHPPPYQLFCPPARRPGALFVPRPRLRPRGPPISESKQLLLLSPHLHLQEHHFFVPPAHNRLIKLQNHVKTSAPFFSSENSHLSSYFPRTLSLVGVRFSFGTGKVFCTSLKTISARCKKTRGNQEKFFVIFGLNTIESKNKILSRKQCFPQHPCSTWNTRGKHNM